MFSQSLLADLLEDDLSELTYDAQLAGLGYSVGNHRGGLVISVSGYNDKLGTLLDTVVRRLVEFEVKPDRLKVISEQVGFSSFISGCISPEFDVCRSKGSTKTST